VAAIRFYSAEDVSDLISIILKATAIAIDPIVNSRRNSTAHAQKARAIPQPEFVPKIDLLL
jgi:hypothetical protein